MWAATKKVLLEVRAAVHSLLNCLLYQRRAMQQAVCSPCAVHTGSCLQEKQQEAVVEKCREAYLAMLQRNASGRVLSHRARSHLKQACLAAATHKVLLEEAPVSGYCKYEGNVTM